MEGAYAIHAWGDDLPAGGWCLCPSCRSFSPEDQSMIAMNLLGGGEGHACQPGGGSCLEMGNGQNGESFIPFDANIQSGNPA